MMSLYDKLNLIAPINSLGYGIFTLGVIKELNKLKRPYNLFPIGNVNWAEVETYCHDMEINYLELVDSILNERQLDEIKYQYPTVIMWHAHELDKYIKVDKTDYKSRHKIMGFTQFETDYFDLKLLKRLSDSLDIVSTSSSWGTGIILNAVSIPNKANPQFGPCTPLLLSKNIEPIESIRQFFNFANKDIVISSGKWEFRKDQETILTEYSKIDNPEKVIFGFWYNAFTGGNKEPIEWLHRLGFTLQESIEIHLQEVIRADIYKNDKGGTVVLFPRINRWIDLMRLYRTGTYFLSISKGEGWDLPALECIGLGLPVLLSLNTAHFDYSPIFGGFNCEPKLAYDGKWFFGEGNWYPIKNIDLLTSTLSKKFDNKTLKLLTIDVHQKSSLNSKIQYHGI